jgi:hypothetical protein
VVFAIDEDSGELSHVETLELEGSPFYVGAFRID